MAVAHYLDALVWQRDAVALHTIFGGKNPHPNFVVGGTPSAISIWPDHPGRGKGPHYRGGQGGTALDVTGLAARPGGHPLDARLRRPGLRARHAGHRRLLQGLVPPGRGPRQLPDLRRLPGQRHGRSGSFLLPRGAILNRDLSQVARGRPQRRRTRSQEFVSHSWYDYAGGQGRRACIPTRARRSSTTAAPSRPTSSSTWTRPIPG